MAVRKRTWTSGKGERSAWVVDYLDASGKRRTQTFARKKEADAYEAQARVDVRAGVHVPDSASVTIREAWDRWKATGETSGLERSTLAQRRQHVEGHILPFLGTCKLNKLTGALVRQFQDDLRTGDAAAADGNARHAPRSAEMVRRASMTLGGLLAYAEERHLVSRNVVREMSRKRQPAGQRHKRRLEYGIDIPTREEIAAIVAAATGRHRPLLLTAIFTGLRASELRGLRWADVELDKERLHVRQRADRYLAIGSPKSGAGRRTIPLPPILVASLKEWKSTSTAGALDLVFGTSKGKPQQHTNLIRWTWQPVQVSAGVTVDTGARDELGQPILAAKYPGLHSLRHFYASWCLNRRADGGLELSAKQVQTRLGHSTIAMTMDTYGHLFPTADEADALAAAERALLDVTRAGARFRAAE